MPLSDHMSRWAQYRERYTRRKNAFLLLTLSGTIRSADAELAYCRERLATGDLPPFITPKLRKLTPVPDGPRVGSW